MLKRPNKSNKSKKSETKVKKPIVKPVIKPERYGWRHVKNKVDEFYLDNSEVGHKTGTFLGYCPKCHIFVSTLDLKGKKKVTCPSCHYECFLSALKKEKMAKKWRNKREYMDNIYEVDAPLEVSIPLVSDIESVEETEVGINDIEIGGEP